MNRKKDLLLSIDTSSLSRTKKNVLAKQSRGKPAKPSALAKRRQKKKLDIQQAISEALDDYTAENVDAYSSYESELVSESPAVTPKVETKRKHSFDLQMTRSPILTPKPKPVEEVIPPLSLEVKEPIVKGPTLEDFHDAADDLYDSLFQSGASPVPTKSALPPKQKEELHRMLFEIVLRKAQMPPDDADDVAFFFDTITVSALLYELRFESPYGASSRSALLEALAAHSLDFEALVAGRLAQFALQFVLDERETQFSPDDDFAAVQKQIGGVHRYVGLFHALVESLKTDVAMLPPTSAPLAQRYTARAQRLLRSVECFVRSRDTIEKYTETVAACTVSLFSVAPALIAPFYAFVLKHWPRGHSEKTIALIGFLEILLSSSPPLYLTPFLKPVVTRVFRRVCEELLGDQVEISKRAAYFMQDYYLRCNYIAIDEAIGTLVKVALTKGMDHWNEIIAVTCEKAFDVILDDI
ncbi:hypothetical protein BLSTO_04932 [Blastocystis sp. subtype 1]